MSKENVAKLKDELQKRPELQQKLKEVKDVETLVVLAKAEGFDFTKEEFMKFEKEVMQSKKLSDDELDKVSGGGLYTSYDYLKTTVGYGCKYWEAASTRAWIGVRGTCGSCRYWGVDNYLDALFIFAGGLGICSNQNNIKK